MLTIWVDEHSPRIDYTFEVLSQLMGEWPIAIQTQSPDPELPYINYRSELVPGAFNLPCSGLLVEEHIRSDAPVHSGKGENLQLFSTLKGSWDIPFDLPAAAFHLLTDYEKYQVDHFDDHARYDPKAYPSSEYGLEQIPVVHHWAQMLKTALSKRFPKLKELPHLKSPPPYEITVDIDQPWRYQHKGKLAFWGGWLKDFMQGNWEEARRRGQTFEGQKDPNDTFDILFELIPPERGTFFCLLGGSRPPDSRFNEHTPAFRELIQHIQHQGYQLGIHPSYHSFLNPNLINQEAQSLGSITGKSPTFSRQHYLRYRLPNTFRSLLSAGIKQDYSLCLYLSGGFPQGMARAFPWFDLAQNKETSLMLHPTILMDRSLMQYAQLTPQQAMKRAQTLLLTTQKYLGTFTLLIHNDALSEMGEWRGWGHTLRNCLIQVRNLS